MLLLLPRPAQWCRNRRKISGRRLRWCSSRGGFADVRINYGQVSDSYQRLLKSQASYQCNLNLSYTHSPLLKLHRYLPNDLKALLPLICLLSVVETRILMSQPPFRSSRRTVRRLSEPNAPIAATSNHRKLTYCVLTCLAARNTKPYYL